jgi:DNA-binding protein H-NS
MGSIKKRPYQPAKQKNAAGTHDVGIDALKMASLDHLAIDELMALKEQVETILSERVAAEKQALKAKLAQLERFTRSASDQTSHHDQPKGRAKPAPKYRNPVTGETWAGRGLRPRWMAKAIESGATPEEFLIQKPHLVHSVA